MMGRVEALVDEDMRRDSPKRVPIARGLVALALLLVSGLAEAEAEAVAVLGSGSSFPGRWGPQPASEKARRFRGGAADRRGARRGLSLWGPPRSARIPFLSLLRCDALSIHFGDRAILEGASFALEPGERVCLIGRNGAGKSTLLSILSGEVEPDGETVQARSGLRVSSLPQALPEESALTVRAYLREALAPQFERLAALEALSAEASDDASLEKLAALQAELDAMEGWQPEQQVEAVLSQLSLPGQARMGALSGGWRRRVALGRALVTKPELLLLDEPTNHLDLATIAWLEEVLLGFSGTVVFITHDRAFLERLATRIVEIDRGAVQSWPGGYGDYLRLKAQALDAEAAEEALFDKRLAQEEAWIRQGIKARRTRNEGRVRALEALRRTRAERVQRQGRAEVALSSGEASGKRVLDAQGLTQAFAGRTLLKGLDLEVLRGDRIGIVGNNGVGKTTLLRILLGDLSPEGGVVRRGTQLSIGYFDQTREGLRWDQSIAFNVAEGRDTVTVGGVDRHIFSYLQGFLFTPERARTEIRHLSGAKSIGCSWPSSLPSPTTFSCSMSPRMI